MTLPLSQNASTTDAPVCWQRCSIVVFFAGIAAAYYIAKLPRLVKGILDVILTLPLVLPPTVVGYLLLRVKVATGAAPAEGSTVAMDILAEKCFCYRRA